MDKIYIVPQELNQGVDLSKALVRRNYLIELNNGLWHLSKYGLPEGGTKYDCLSYIVENERYFNSQWILFLWNSMYYVFTDEGRRLVSYCRDIIDYRDEEKRKTHVLVIDCAEMRMKELADRIYRAIESPEKIEHLQIGERIEFPHGIQIFEMEI